MGVILYGMLIAHIVGYKDEYLKIGTTFATTMMVKIVVKGAGSKDHATMCGIGGGFVTIKQVLGLLEKITHKGFDSLGVTDVNKNGIVGDMIQSITELLTPKE